MRTHAKEKRQGLVRRHRRVRKKVVGSPERPRLCVYRSNKHIYAQVVDDFAGRTLAAASSRTVAAKDRKSAATAVGRAVAAKAKAAGITAVTFDRGGFLYHGRVAAVAEGAREEGLKF